MSNLTYGSRLNPIFFTLLWLPFDSQFLGLALTYMKAKVAQIAKIFKIKIVL